jgi:hypothetical protein
VDKLEKVDTSRRDALMKLVQGSAFAIPVVASFAMGGMAPAQAQTSNSNIASVPTMEEWALPLLAGGLGAAALVAMNKTRKKV